MGGPGEPSLIIAHDWEGEPWGSCPGLGRGSAGHELGEETRAVGTMPDLEDRLWGVLLPVLSGELEEVTLEKGL